MCESSHSLSNNNNNNNAIASAACKIFCIIIIRLPAIAAGHATRRVGVCLCVISFAVCEQQNEKLTAYNIFATYEIIAINKKLQNACEMNSSECKRSFDFDKLRMRKSHLRKSSLHLCVWDECACVCASVYLCPCTRTLLVSIVSHESLQFLRWRCNWKYFNGKLDNTLHDVRACVCVRV